MMRKRLQLWLVLGLVIVCVCLPVAVSAAPPPVPTAIPDVYPDYAPFKGSLYFDVQCSPLGRAMIVIPIDYQEFYFSQTRNSPAIVNISNGTITGQIYYGSHLVTSTQVRFQRFGTAEWYYNYSGSSWRWDPLTITAVYATNVVVADNGGATPLSAFDLSEALPIIFLFLVCALFLLFLMRRVWRDYVA